MGLKLTQIGNNIIMADKGIEGAIFRAPVKANMNLDYSKAFRTSRITDTAIAIPTTRREFMKMIDKIRDYKSKVTDLIIEAYGGIKC